MTFPNITIKTKNLTLTLGLQETLEKRLNTLARLMPKRDTAVLLEAELSKTTKHHQSGKVFRAEFNLSIEGEMLRAEAIEETIENAIDHAKNELKGELEKFNSKAKTLARAGARKAKALTQKSAR